MNSSLGLKIYLIIHIKITVRNIQYKLLKGPHIYYYFNFVIWHLSSGTNLILHRTNPYIFRKNIFKVRKYLLLFWTFNGFGSLTFLLSVIFRGWHLYDQKVRRAGKYSSSTDKSTLVINQQKQLIDMIFKTYL